MRRDGCPGSISSTTRRARRPSAAANGVSGYVDTNVAALVRRMHELLADHGTAARLGAGARAAAAMRFGIDRFVEDWEAALEDTAGAAPSWSPRAKGEIA